MTSLKTIDDIVVLSDDVPSEDYQQGTAQQTVWDNYTGPDGGFELGLWHSQAGTWDIAYTRDESCTILDGSAQIIDSDGNAIALQTGDSICMPAGLTGKWVVDNGVTKVFSTYNYTGKKFEPKGVKDIVRISDEVAVESYQHSDSKIPQNVTSHYVGHDDNFAFGWWDSGAGTWDVNFTEDETCEFLEGDVTITDKNGDSRSFSAGDIICMPAGFQGQWTVPKYIKKIYTVYNYG